MADVSHRARVYTGFSCPWSPDTRFRTGKQGAKGPFHSRGGEWRQLSMAGTTVRRRVPGGSAPAPVSHAVRQGPWRRCDASESLHEMPETRSVRSCLHRGGESQITTWTGTPPVIFVCKCVSDGQTHTLAVFPTGLTLWESASSAAVPFPQCRRGFVERCRLPRQPRAGVRAP